MDPDEQDRNRRLYFKNLCKEQKKRRQKRKKEELQRSQEERKEQFEALVQNVRQRVAAGEDLKQWETNKLAELFANDIYVASICPFRNVPVSGSGNCIVTTKEQSERMDME